MREVSSQWAPSILFVGNWRMFAPYRLSDLVTLPAATARVTALATAPAGDLALYSVTDAVDSTIHARRIGDSAVLWAGKPIARGTELADDLWFHQPMYLSPDKRWIAVSASVGRRQAVASWDDSASGTLTRASESPSEIWLVDAAGARPPRRLLADARLLSCSWSPDGQQAALSVKPDGILLLDAERGALQPIAPGDGPTFWSADARTVRVYPSKGSPGEMLIYDVSSRAVEHVTEGGGWPPSGDAQWSSDGRRWAYPENRDGNSGVRIGELPGRSRKAPTMPGHLRLLGWSGRAEVLAYIAGDQTLRFSAGAVTDAEYERLMSALPQVGLERDESQPGAAKSAREDTALDTTISPLKVNTDGPVLSAWAETKDGPCLVYSDVEKGTQKVEVLRFTTLTLEDLGLDPHQDLATQILRQRVDNSAYQLAKALQDYARKYGRLPVHPGGLNLEEDLRPYLLSASALRGADMPDDVCAHLLLPGATVEQLAAGAERKCRVKVAEVRDAGMVFGVYAEPQTDAWIAEQLGDSKPLAVSFNWDVEVDLPGAPPPEPGDDE